MNHMIKEYIKQRQSLHEDSRISGAKNI